MATLPATLSLFGAYSSPDGTKWNFDGNNDAALVTYMNTTIANLVGKAPNAYKYFVRGAIRPRSAATPRGAYGT